MNTTQNNEMKVIREVSIQAENCYSDAIKLGEHAAYALKASHRSQMTGLENVAESTFKKSDVFDYIKRQTARLPYWRQPFPEVKNSDAGFGERLKDFLEKELTKKRDVICTHLDIGDVTDEERLERNRIYLLLIRQFIRHMVVHYEYLVSTHNNKKRES